MGEMVDVTIRMPKDWLDDFYDWYIDGDGEARFLADRDPSGQGGVTYGDSNRDRRLIVHSENEADMICSLAARCGVERGA